MGVSTIILPDVGEGIAEAELTEWQVKIGDIVKEDDILAVVMTDKAAIEVPSSTEGTVTWLAGEVGDTVAIGAPLVKLDVQGEGHGVTHDVTPEVIAEPVIPVTLAIEKSQAGPSVRKRAKEAGVSLLDITGTGPGGRILHEDIDQFLSPVVSAKPQSSEVKQIKVTGMRRKIADKMALSKAHIPHITIVEEVDMTNLEDLRRKLNEKYKSSRAKLTILPFMMRAIVEAVRAQPEINAHYDDVANIIAQHGNVHIGIATQTPAGLSVPVVKNAQSQNLWDSAQNMLRLSELARNGKATRDDLTGSTITITSLGALGAIASTPIINYPEVAIIGINKMAIRPMWDKQQFLPRTMMNISCSFDHRVIDGYDAALFVQSLKTLLETPALLFIEG
jgi:2-oxoisovalerate dehydrogenase E2 component (dihydrolipoyl transacylase)